MIADPRYSIFRDDDVGLIENAENYKRYKNRFVAAHELYNKYQVIHELGYITGDQKSQGFITEYIKSQNNIIVQLHAHVHCDFTKLSEEELNQQFDSGIKIIEDVFGKRPEKWYPPHHSLNDAVVKIANSHGLAVDAQPPISIQYFVQRGKPCFRPKRPMTICHHYWSPRQADFLERGLSMYRQFIAEYDEFQEEKRHKKYMAKILAKMGVTPPPAS